MSEENLPTEDEALMRRMSRRSFVWGAAGLASMFGAAHWIFTRRSVDGVPWPLRRGFEANEGFWSDAFSRNRRIPELPPERLTAERVNGAEGLSEDFDPSQWSLTIEGVAGKAESIVLTLADLQAMPHTEMITELCCIEGWSIVQRWKGVRMIDFARKYPPGNAAGESVDLDQQADQLVRYVGMETPDSGYYVGLDMASALHPQTLLCWEMNGKPLTLEHGAPLRLVIPVKYGIKNLKRIGTIRYTDVRPRDYWAEQGYDWYAGL